MVPVKNARDVSDVDVYPVAGLTFTITKPNIKVSASAPGIYRCTVMIEEDGVQKIDQIVRVTVLESPLLTYNIIQTSIGGTFKVNPQEYQLAPSHVL